MSRSTYLVTALALVLAGTFAFAQTTGGQQSGQQQWQSNTGSSGSSAGGSTGQISGSNLAERTTNAAQKVATIADQQNIDLYKAVRTAEQQGKGKAIGAVLMQPRDQRMGGSSMGQGGSTGQGSSDQSSAGSTSGQQTLTAHVFVASDSQLQLVSVDPKSNKVLNTRSTQAIQNAWNPEASATGGSSGSSSSDGSSSGSSMGQGGSTGQDQTSAQGQSSQQGRLLALTLDRAERIYRQADQQNADLSRIIQTAERQTHGKAVAAFLAIPGQRSIGGSSGSEGSSGSMSDQSTGSTSSQQLVAHVFTIADNQLKLVVIDPKTNKVNTTETRQMLAAPWENQTSTTGSTGGSSYDQSGQGGSTGGSSYDQSGQGSSISQDSSCYEQSGQGGSTAKESTYPKGQDPNQVPNFPTGSSGGSGRAGDLGGD